MKGGVLSAMFCNFDMLFMQKIPNLFFKQNIVASVTKAATVRSQQLSQCPTMVHRFIVSAKTRMNLQ